MNATGSTYSGFLATFYANGKICEITGFFASEKEVYTYVYAEYSTAYAVLVTKI